MTIAERIRLIRQQRKLSQTELADRSGVNLKSLSRYELGTSVPPADALKLLADALQVSADSLLTDDVATVKDMELLRKFEVIQELTGETRSVVNTFLDMVIRDFRTKQAYAQ
jgi:transcriptional regulator with XRE-family HTH domain